MKFKKLQRYTHSLSSLHFSKNVGPIGRANKRKIRKKNKDFEPNELKLLP